MNTFSQQLVDRLIRYMNTKHGVSLKPEQANEYLRVYADTFLAFTKDGERGPTRRLNARGVPAADLITPHNCKSVS